MKKVSKRFAISTLLLIVAVFGLMQIPNVSSTSSLLSYASTTHASTPTCPTGHYWDGHQCHTNPSATTQTACPIGQHWDGQKCVCPPEYHSDGNKCILISSSQRVTAPTTAAPSCPSGKHWNGHECVPNSPPTPTPAPPQRCQLGQYWDGHGCVIITHRCPADQYWNRYECSPIHHDCRSDEYWNGQRCVPVPRNYCGPGTYWNGYNCLPIPQSCPTGTYWDGNKCVPDWIYQEPPGTSGRIVYCEPYTPYPSDDPCSGYTVPQPPFLIPSPELPPPTSFPTQTIIQSQTQTVTQSQTQTVTESHIVTQAAPMFTAATVQPIPQNKSEIPPWSLIVVGIAIASALGTGALLQRRLKSNSIVRFTVPSVFCTKCGRQIYLNSRFCDICGSAQI